MKKKRKVNLGTTDFAADQSTATRQLNGFWLLLKITETIYKNAQKANTVITRCKPSISALIEPAFIRITWHPGQTNEKIFPFDFQRGRIFTNEITDGNSIRARAELTGLKMNWRFVVNYTAEHYSQFSYEFIRDEE